MALDWRHSAPLAHYYAYVGSITLEVAQEDLHPKSWCAYVLGQMSCGHTSSHMAQEWAEAKLKEILLLSLRALGE